MRQFIFYALLWFAGSFVGAAAVVDASRKIMRSKLLEDFFERLIPLAGERFFFLMEEIGFAIMHTSRGETISFIYFWKISLVIWPLCILLWICISVIFLYEKAKSWFK